MEDVQNRPAELLIPIDRVGIRALKVPLEVDQRNGGSQYTVAIAELGVDLPMDFKGTHMSRFVEILEVWDKHMSYAGMQALLELTKDRLAAQRAQITLSFPYFVKKLSPASNCSALQSYECSFTGVFKENKAYISLEVVVPVMTVCPCSKAISKEGAHSQRADIRIFVQLKSFCWLEEFIDIAEKAGSSPTYPLLKRKDEKFVTESAFSHPQFVEDVVRYVASSLQGHSCVALYRVEVESYESIHAHNAFAWIEGSNTAIE